MAETATPTEAEVDPVGALLKGVKGRLDSIGSSAPAPSPSPIEAAAKKYAQAAAPEPPSRLEEAARKYAEAAAPEAATPPDATAPVSTENPSQASHEWTPHSQQVRDKITELTGQTPAPPTETGNEATDNAWVSKTAQDYIDKSIKDGAPLTMLGVMAYLSESGLTSTQKRGVMKLLQDQGVLQSPTARDNGASLHADTPDKDQVDDLDSVSQGLNGSEPEVAVPEGDLVQIPEKYRGRELEEGYKNARDVLDNTRQSYLEEKRANRSPLRRIAYNISAKLHGEKSLSKSLGEWAKEYENAKRDFAIYEAYRKAERKVAKGKLVRELPQDQQQAKGQEYSDKIAANKDALTKAFAHDAPGRKAWNKLKTDKIFSEYELKSIEQAGLITADTNAPEYQNQVIDVLKATLKEKYKIEVTNNVLSSLTSEIKQFEAAELDANKKSALRELLLGDTPILNRVALYGLLTAATAATHSAGILPLEIASRMALGGMAARDATHSAEYFLENKSNLFGPKDNESFMRQKAALYEQRVANGKRIASQREIALNQKLGAELGAAIRSSDINDGSPENMAKVLETALSEQNREGTSINKLNRIRKIKNLKNMAAFTAAFLIGAASIPNLSGEQMPQFMHNPAGGIGEASSRLGNNVAQNLDSHFGTHLESSAAASAQPMPHQAGPETGTPATAPTGAEAALNAAPATPVEMVDYTREPGSGAGLALTKLGKVLTGIDFTNPADPRLLSAIDKFKIDNPGGMLDQYVSQFTNQLHALNSTDVVNGDTVSGIARAPLASDVLETARKTLANLPPAPPTGT